MKLILAAALAWAAVPPVETAKDVDLARFMGTWYEVAVIPNGPQKGCADTVVHYRLHGEGFELLNTCWKGEKYKPYHGKAKPVEAGSKSKFYARFFMILGADYWILDVDPQYRWASVGNPDRDRLWIISRTPTLEAAAYDALVARAKAQGFPVEKLVRTAHTGRPVPADPWKS